VTYAERTARRSASTAAGARAANTSCRSRCYELAGLIRTPLEGVTAVPRVVSVGRRSTRFTRTSDRRARPGSTPLGKATPLARLRAGQNPPPHKKGIAQGKAQRNSKMMVGTTLTDVVRGSASTGIDPKGRERSPRG